MQDRVQLKREEAVGDGVALSDINPLTNTKSVDDTNSGESLNVTIERIWAAINNSLSRIVNSVNGRDGVVVITAEDVGLGNVTNVSFSTIKDWVIEEIMREFGVRAFKLFDTYAEYAETANSWAADKSRDGTAFFIKVGKLPSDGETGDMRSQIGYFHWDGTTLVASMRPVNVIQEADNSIIYNENIGDKNYGERAKIGVNIWRGEDALKLYNNSSKGMSGLYIDKSKVAPQVFFFDGVYGNGIADPNGLIYVPDGSVPNGAKEISVYINNEQIGGTWYTFQNFKIYDLVVTNFSDAGYRDGIGYILNGLSREFVSRDACIGSITSVDTSQSTTKYILNFYTIKPYVGMGLKYYDVHTDSSETGPNGSMIGVDLLHGAVIQNQDPDNISGLNAFNTVDPEYSQMSPLKKHHTVTPIGDKVTNESHTYNGLFIAPDFSLNVIPYNAFTDISNPITNWPIQSPAISTGISEQSFLGVNLLKKIDIVESKAFNMAGLRIIKDTDIVSNTTLGKSDDDASDKLDQPIDPSDPRWVYTSGGLAVNVGRFLEIGTFVGDDATARTAENYYDGGKVNVRVNDMFFTDNADNKLDLRLSHYTSFVYKNLNDTIGGGLVYTEGHVDEHDDWFRVTPGLAVNRGLGLRMSHYDRFGNIPEEYSYEPVLEEPDPFDATQYWKQVLGEYVQGEVGDTWNSADTWYTRIDNNLQDQAYLAVSVIDAQHTSEDVGASADERIRGYGGLRYMIGTDDVSGHVSSIGLRVNNSEDQYGHQLRLGSKAIGIDENNIVQVQLYHESDDPLKDMAHTNPLEIRGWDEEAIYPYVNIPDLKKTVVVTDANHLPGKVADPLGRPADDTVYYVQEESKRYVWTGNGFDYVPMFTEYDPSTTPTGEWNRVYVETIVDNINHTFVGNAYQWSKGYTIHLPGSWIPDEHYPDGGYYNDEEPDVDAVMASKVLGYYAAISTDFTEGYYNDGKFYSRSDHHSSSEIIGVDGHKYADITYGKPYLMYIYKDALNAFVPLMVHASSDPVVGGLPYSQKDLIPCDIDNNGHIDARDATKILAYYTYNVTTHVPGDDDYIPEYEEATTARDKFAAWLKFFGYAEDSQAQYVKIHGTDPDGSFMPGLDININEYQGCTTNLHGDICDAVAVKIYDKTAGIPNCATENGNDPINPASLGERGLNLPNPSDLLARQGGLRFNEGGYLGVRVNAMNNYNATTSNGRTGSDACRCKTYLNGDLIGDLGARGLRIYGNNVLGIQLDESGSLDNGQLAFDEFGSLIISPNYSGGGGGGEYLTITDGTTTVQYNGSTAMNITLGPGLILEPDPEPEPEPEPEPNNEEPGE